MNSSSATQTAVLHTILPGSAEAGHDLGERVLEALEQQKPDAIILFVSPTYDAKVLAGSLMDSCDPGVLIGASSAGEFTNETQGVGQACAVAIRSSSIQFRAGMGRGITKNRQTAAE